MYQEACKLEPENLMYPPGARGDRAKKFGNDRSKVGRLVGARTQPIRMRARSARSKGHCTQALEICEEAFAHNPWDSGAARTPPRRPSSWAEAARPVVDRVGAAAIANDADFFRYAAHVHEMNASWQKAIACWERVKKLNPQRRGRHRIDQRDLRQRHDHTSGLSEALNRRRKAAPGQSRPWRPSSRS